MRMISRCRPEPSASSSDARLEGTPGSTTSRWWTSYPRPPPRRSKRVSLPRRLTLPRRESTSARPPRCDRARGGGRDHDEIVEHVLFLRECHPELAKDPQLQRRSREADP